jgi:hypothetical protein
MNPSPMYGQAHGLGMATNALNDAFTQLLIIYFVRKMRGEQTKKENIRFTTLIQQLHNNLSHEGRSHTLELTFM